MSEQSDLETARYLEAWLEREHPGTSWEVTVEAPQDGTAIDEKGEV